MMVPWKTASCHEETAELSWLTVRKVVTNGRSVSELPGSGFFYSVNVLAQGRAGLGADC